MQLYDVFSHLLYNSFSVSHELRVIRMTAAQRIKTAELMPLEYTTAPPLMTRVGVKEFGVIQAAFFMMYQVTDAAPEHRHLTGAYIVYNPNISRVYGVERLGEANPALIDNKGKDPASQRRLQEQWGQGAQIIVDMMRKYGIDAKKKVSGIVLLSKLQDGKNHVCMVPSFCPPDETLWRFDRPIELADRRHLVHLTPK